MKLKFPPPDMVFPNSILKVSLTGREILSWNPYLVLKEVSEEPPFLFNSPKLLKKIVPQRSSMSSSSISSSPFKYDWTFSSTYSGMMEPIMNSDAICINDAESSVEYIFDKKILQQNEEDPIVMCSSWLIYEDELGDMGKSIFSIRMRITKKYMFILTRSWLELPMQHIYRSIEHRWMAYSNVSPPFLRHEFCIKELVDVELRPNHGTVDADVFRDAESALLNVVHEEIKVVKFYFW